MPNTSGEEWDAGGVSGAGSESYGGRPRDCNGFPRPAALQTGQLALDFTEADNLVLQGSTAALRAALGPFLDWTGAFASPTEWRRVSEASMVLRPVELACFEAAAWREADRLFRGDPYWRGSDVASSVELVGGRTLWLFGDTWIDPSGRGTREGARMISNSLGIQEGLDPTTARMSFYWGRTAEGAPDAFFPDRDGEAHWFGSGVRVDNRLVLFFSRTVRHPGSGLGFEHVGWTAQPARRPARLHRVVPDGRPRVCAGSPEPHQEPPHFRRPVADGSGGAGRPGRP